jgi:F-type H+-transporting ATPase subunit alpha
MAELTFDTGDITAALRSNLEGWSPTLESETMGYVASVGDGVARVTGLPTAMASELLEFPGGLLGVALNLDEDSIGAVIMGDASGIEEGDEVRSTGRVLSVPVGDELLGRVVDPLGNPIDGKGPLNTTKRRFLETQAPTVVERQPVNVPLQTGLKAIDAMTPIGRGQRQLIIGDRQTGKTAIGVDTILAQKGQGVKCIYVAIGQKNSTVANVVATLEAAGAMEYTVVVNASAGDAAALQMYAPYAGSAMGQHWMYEGGDALIIFDDLTKQAIAYREISLLLRRPPGREAYPGDVFYLHSRLLERCARLSDELGGGSLTGLPIIETKANDVSAYIPTNVISITDGQIFLESDLFNAGIRPAINAGLSVSRVGGAAQTKIIKKLGGSVRLALAQYRELAAFAQFASDLDDTTRAQLERGERVTELMKQAQYSPMTIAEMAMSLYAANEGYLDEVPVNKIVDFEAAMLAHVKSSNADLIENINASGDYNDEIEAAMRAALDEFKTNGAY